MNTLAPLGAALIALSLGGCAALIEAPPPAPSVADIHKFHGRMLDLTWDGFHIPPALGPPPVEPAGGLAPAEWGDALRLCMEAAGYPEFGYTWTYAEGYVLLSNRGERVYDLEEQVAFYFCVAQHPLVPDTDGLLVSAEQVNYVYDYYRRWTVPCLIDNGYAPQHVFSREEFATAMGAWAPYWELPINSEQELEQVIARCGPIRPALEPASGAEASP